LELWGADDPDILQEKKNTFMNIKPRWAVFRATYILYGGSKPKQNVQKILSLKTALKLFKDAVRILSIKF
jgi:hypothetical protein